MQPSRLAIRDKNKMQHPIAREKINFGRPKTLEFFFEFTLPSGVDKCGRRSWVRVNRKGKALMIMSL